MINARISLKKQKDAIILHASVDISFAKDANKNGRVDTYANTLFLIMASKDGVDVTWA